MTDADLNRGALEATPSWLKPAAAPAPAPAPVVSSPAPTSSSNWVSQITPTGTPTTSSPAPTSSVPAQQTNFKIGTTAQNIAETNANFNYTPLPTTTKDVAPFSNETPVTQQQLQQQAAAAEAAGTNQGGRTSAQIQAEQQATTDATKIATEKAAADKIAADKVIADKAAADAAAAATAKSFQDKIDATNKALDDNYTKITNLITSLANGTIALTANQQTLINSIQTNLEKATAAQKTANTNYEAGLTQAGIAAGRNRYAPEIEMGNIYNAINVGAAKINDLDAAAVSKKAELMEQFQTNNFTNAMAGYKELQSILKDKEDSIIKLEEMSRSYAKDQAAVAYQAQQDAITNKISLIDKGYEPISDITGLTPDQYVKVGNEYFKKPAITVDATNDIKEYEYAKTTGAYTGTFMDYLAQKANLKEGSYEPTDAQVTSRAKYLQDQDEMNGVYESKDYVQLAIDQLKTQHGTSGTNTGYNPTPSTSVPGGATGKTVTSNGVTFDIGTYATDPNHEASVANILNKIGTMNSVDDINAYIQQVAPGSSVTGDMIANASSQYNIPWEIQMAMMQQDSNFGTAGKGARTFNPGNVGNTDSGAEVNYKDWQSGVNALASNLSRRVVQGEKQEETNYKDIITKNQQTLLASIPATERANFIKSIQKSAASGDKEQVKEAIYSGIIENSKSGKDISTQTSKVDAFQSIKDAFQTYYDAGGTTGPIKGTFNNLLNKIGQTSDPKLQALKANIIAARMKFRNDITGAAWGEQEDGEYNTIIGGITDSKDKNLSGVNGALNSLKTDLGNRIKKVTGNEIYDTFFKEDITNEPNYLDSIQKDDEPKSIFEKIFKPNTKSQTDPLGIL